MGNVDEHAERSHERNQSGHSFFHCANSAMVLVLSNNHRRILEQSAEACWPDECCGILVGRRNSDFSTVDEVVVAANVACGDRSRRYEIAHRTVFDALRHAKAIGLDVLGFYHSHPDGSSNLSSRDIEALWPGRIYVILSMGEARAVGMRAWMGGESGTGVVEVLIELTDVPEIG